jgi:hypothetical protein
VKIDSVRSAFGGWPREVSTPKERKLGEVDDASILSPLRATAPAVAAFRQQSPRTVTQVRGDTVARDQRISKS